MTKNLLTVALCSLFAATAGATNINYSLTINGGTDFESIGAGTHTLGIWGEVTDNILQADQNGGILQFSVNLDAPGVTFAEGTGGFPPAPTGEWLSDFVGDFTTNFPGKLDAGGYSVFSQTGSVGAANFGNHVFTYGSTGPSLLTSGEFTWDGMGEISIEVVPGDLSGNLIFGDQGGGAFGAVSPDSASGMTVRLGSSTDIPEPATMGLAGLAIAGVLGFRRRR